MKISPRSSAAALAATLLALACAWTPPSAAAAGVSVLSDKDSVAGLKAALGQGTERAVSMLGATDGFLGNPAVRIPLPPTLAKGERMFKMLGLDKQAKLVVRWKNKQSLVIHDKDSKIGTLIHRVLDRLEASIERRVERRREKRTKDSIHPLDGSN